MNDNDICYCMDVLHKTTVYPLNQHLIDDYETIDVLVCKLIDEAEGLFRKLQTGSNSWSSAYKKSSLLLEYLLIRRKCFNSEHKNIGQIIIL